MSWSGTVRCSYCGIRGHNRRGCPKYKLFIAERRSTHGESDYYVAAADRKASSSKVRQCSYCKETGHNRRSCGTLKTDKLKASARILANRQTIVKWFRENASSHPGVGSIVWQYNHPYMITNVLWTAFDRMTTVDNVITRIERQNSYQEIWFATNLNPMAPRHYQTTRLGNSCLFEIPNQVNGTVPPIPENFFNIEKIQELADTFFDKDRCWYRGFY